MVLLSCFSAWSLERDPFENISTRQLEVLDGEIDSTDTREDVIKSVLNKFLLEKIEPWDPQPAKKGSIIFNGNSIWRDSPQCSSDALENAIVKNRDIPTNRVIKEFFNRCHSKLFQLPHHKLITLYKTVNVHYNFKNHPRIKPVKLTLEDGFIMRGFLALKKDLSPRPMVIIRCGIFCNSDDSHVGRMYLMHLFDESPFNVLLLGNSTGGHSHRDNHAMALGGFDEGMQLLRTAKLINNNSALSRRVSSFHIFAASLGSHGALFSGIYSSHRLSKYPKINSITAICPVVDLKQTFNTSFHTKYRRNVFYHLTKKVLKNAYPFIPILRELIPNPDRINSKKISSTIAKAALHYYKTKGPEWSLPPFSGTMINSDEKFWRANNYLNYHLFNKVPTLVIGSIDDPIVLYKDNMSKLEDTLSVSPSPYIQAIKLKQGSHCGQSINYSRSLLSSVYRSFILSHSPTLIDNNIQEMDIADVFSSISLRKGDTFFDSTWAIKHGSNDVSLKLKVWRKSGFHCAESEISEPCKQQDKTLSCEDIDPYKNKYRKSCFRDIRTSVPLRDFKQLGMSAPVNKTEAQALTRWANTHIKLLNSNNKDMPYTQKPEKIVWRGQP